MSIQYLLSRSYGDHRSRALQIAETTYLLYALQPSPVSFHQDSVGENTSTSQAKRSVAHASGVNAIAIDKFEGRYLLSGGADSSVALWDLESRIAPDATYKPLLSTAKTSDSHSHGITHLSFYPFDSLAFLTSSYDHTLKIYSSETLIPSASFNLASVIYDHALSPIASHLLVACATQHPSVRLVDLRSGASTHSLAGHSGAVLSCAWSPVRDHILASGAIDGTVRLWDIRRGAAELGSLDMEDSRGIVHRPDIAAPSTTPGKAHAGPVNGITWTADGLHIVTTGHDARIRVWDSCTAANTLANFGPQVRNSRLARVDMVLAPTGFVEPGMDVLFYPNENEVLMFELFEGRMVGRLRREGKGRGGRGVVGGRNRGDRVMGLAWRAHHVEFYSAHADGSVVSWKPWTEENIEEEEEENGNDGEEQERDGDDDRGGGSGGGVKRKRGVLEDIYQDLTKQKITFGW